MGRISGFFYVYMIPEYTNTDMSFVLEVGCAPVGSLLVMMRKLTLGIIEQPPHVEYSTTAYLYALHAILESLSHCDAGL